MSQYPISMLRRTSQNESCFLEYFLQLTKLIPCSKFPQNPCSVVRHSLKALPVTTATVEHSFSNMKLMKTRPCSTMGEDTLEHTMRISLEGPDCLSDGAHEATVHHYKGVKKR